MSQVLSAAESFVRERHSFMTLNDAKTSHIEHLIGVVNRLKNLGISDEEILAAAWLHDSIENTSTSFDEIDQRFGSRIAVLVLSLSKDKNLPKEQRERQYIEQLKQSVLEAKLIKLCDISANLKDLKNMPLSKNKKIKEVKKKVHYLKVIKPDLIKNKSSFPGIQNIIDGINDTLKFFSQSPIEI